MICSMLVHLVHLRVVRQHASHTACGTPALNDGGGSEARPENWLSPSALPVHFV